MEARVRVISNEECAIWGKYNFKSEGDVSRPKVTLAMPDGIADELLCTIGLDPDNDGKFTVSLSLICTLMVWCKKRAYFRDHAREIVVGHLLSTTQLTKIPLLKC